MPSQSKPSPGDQLRSLVFLMRMSQENERYVPEDILAWARIIERIADNLTEA